MFDNFNVNKLADEIAERDKTWREENQWQEMYDILDNYDWSDIDGYFPDDFDDEDFSERDDGCTPVAYL